MRARTMLMSGGLCLVLSLALIGCGSQPNTPTASPTYLPGLPNPQTAAAGQPVHVEVGQRVLMRGENIHAVVWSPDGTRLAVAARDGRTAIYDGATYRRAATLGETRGLVASNVVWSPDGLSLAMGMDDGSVLIRDVGPGGEIMRLAGHTELVVAVAWSPDGRWVASSSFGDGVGPLALWDITSGAQPVRLGEIAASELVFTRDSAALIAVAWRGGGAVRYDLATGADPVILAGPGASEAMAVSPDGSRLALSTGGYTGAASLTLFDAATGSTLRTIEDARGAATALRWSPRGDLILALHVPTLGGGEEAALYDAELNPVADLPALSEDGYIEEGAWPPDGTRLALIDRSGASSEAAVRIVALADMDGLPEAFRTAGPALTPTPLPAAIAMVAPGPTPTPIPTRTPIPPDAPSAFAGVLPAGAVGRLGQGRLSLVEPSPDGRYVAVGGSIGVWVYDAATYQQRWFARTDWMTQLAWSPDSTMLAGGMQTGEIRVWDYARGMELYTMTVHERAVTSLDWSPDSVRLISAARDGVGVIWDLSNDDPPIVLIRTDGPPEPSYQTIGFYSMHGALSPDGRLYATIYALGHDHSTFDNVIIMWDAVTGAQLRIIRSDPVGIIGSDPITHIEWLPDSAHFLAATETGGLTYLWDATTSDLPERILTESNDYGSTQPSLSPRGDRVTFFNSFEAVILYDLGNQAEIARIDGRPSAVMWSPDGEWLAVSNWPERAIGLLDADTGEEIGRMPYMELSAFSPDGRVAYGWGGVAYESLAAWDVESSERLGTFTTRNNAIHQVAWSPDGTRIAAGMAVWDANEAEAIVWDVATGEVIHQIDIHPLTPEDRNTSTGFFRVAWSPDGSRLAVGSTPVTIWDTETWERVGTIDSHTVRAIAWSPDGAALALVAGTDNNISVYNAATGERIEEFRLVTGWQSNMPLAWSPDGAVLAASRLYDRVALYSPYGEPPFALVADLNDPFAEANDYLIYGVDFSPDGRFLAASVATRDPAVGDVVVWSVEREEVMYRLGVLWDNPTSVDWSPDGTRIAAAFGTIYDQYSYGSPAETYGPIVVWDAQTGARIDTLYGHTSGAQSVAFSPDGSRLASGSQDGTVLIWEAP